MMRSMRFVLLAFAAILAFSAVAATSASATELIRFTKTGKFTGASKAGEETILETKKGTQVKCKSATGSGEVETEESGKATLTFEKCEEPKLKAPCGNGGSKENITAKLGILLGSDTEPPTDTPAVLLTPESVSFECKLAGIGPTISVTGSVICLAKNEANKEEVEVNCKKAAGEAGVQEDKKFWDIHKTNVVNFLESEGTGFGGFAKEESSQQGIALLKGTEGIIQIEAT